MPYNVGVWAVAGLGGLGNGSRVLGSNAKADLVIPFTLTNRYDEDKIFSIHITPPLRKPVVVASWATSFSRFLSFAVYWF